MKRLLALVAGGLGLRALLRRRGRPALSPSLADDLRAKLDASKDPEATREEPVDEARDVDGRRAAAHSRARQAIDELGDS
jgi:hypothetical protein